MSYRKYNNYSTQGTKARHIAVTACGHDGQLESQCLLHFNIIITKRNNEHTQLPTAQTDVGIPSRSLKAKIGKLVHVGK